MFKPCTFISKSRTFIFELSGTRCSRITGKTSGFLFRLYGFTELAAQKMDALSTANSVFRAAGSYQLFYLLGHCSYVFTSLLIVILFTWDH